MNALLRKIPLLLFLSVLFLQGTPPYDLQKEVDRLNGDTVMKHGEWGLFALAQDSGNVIAENNADLSLMPASTMKILTTGAALGLLGPDFQYETTIGYDGTFDKTSGTINGNLYIQGAGDPTLESKYFRRSDSATAFSSIAERLVSSGVKIITGDIIGDASCFSDNALPDGWTWGDLGQYYGAGTSGLDYRDNSVTLHFNSQGKDTCTIDSVTPFPENVRYRSFVTADGKKDEAFVYGTPFGNDFSVYGTIPAGKKNYEVDASDPDPALLCAHDVLHQLQGAGITVNGKCTSSGRIFRDGKKMPSAKRTVLFSLLSPPLSEIVHMTNLHSDNVYAEQLLRTLGYRKGKSGSTEDGIDVVLDFWRSKGLDTDGLHMTDGSGLSRSNLITTKQQASVLRIISQSPWYDVFYRSLPVAGKSGSLAGLCKGTFAENNMHAKSGYIDRARGYAGFVKTRSGKTICFSLLANNYTCPASEMKKRLERILVALAEYGG
ncbi:MAG TPA: D-alanyl-D-alanine carboxypeptidase/D-alanyl-D-alanine-endopeptidase [Bacteroidia bacterium]|nr:D-alanyl-D-alanine carboxypeptidase/D-alanyl-D-alanine-endopeptidase [Bacteroidia bacterium]